MKWKLTNNTEKKKQTNGNIAIWLVCWMDTNARGFGLLSERLAEKT